MFGQFHEAYPSIETNPDALDLMTNTFSMLAKREQDRRDQAMKAWTSSGNDTNAELKADFDKSNPSSTTSSPTPNGSTWPRCGRSTCPTTGGSSAGGGGAWVFTPRRLPAIEAGSNPDAIAKFSCSAAVCADPARRARCCSGAWRLTASAGIAPSRHRRARLAADRGALSRLAGAPGRAPPIGTLCCDASYSAAFWVACVSLRHKQNPCDALQFPRVPGRLWTARPCLLFRVFGSIYSSWGSAPGFGATS